MAGKIKKISLVTNFNIRNKAEAARKVAEYLSGYPCTIYVNSLMKDRSTEFLKCNTKINYVTLQTLYHEVDLLIVLGGDGSILSAARNCGKSDIPILGINLGRIGYMAEMEMDELSLLAKVFDGKYRTDERAMLDVTVLKHGKQQINHAVALNDAVISNGSIARMVDLELSEGGSVVNTYRSDGLIFATPTGSTAYSMAAGGPVIDPNMRCICVTPICPHSLTAKPIIFSDSAELVAKNVCEREKNLYLTLDGKVNFEIYRGDTVKIKKSTLTTKLIRLKERGFYETLRVKMNSN